MTNYFRKLEPTKAEYDLDVYAGTYAYHTLPHTTIVFTVWTEQVYRRNIHVHEQSANQLLATFMLLWVLEAISEKFRFCFWGTCESPI
jgi:hypothetical protein